MMYDKLDKTERDSTPVYGKSKDSLHVVLCLGPRDKIKEITSGKSVMEI